ncbi:decapping enzyme Dcp2 [Penicillium brasilianum]|uniref:Decapping enzyme Dcp2 n=1 Tax=Penicillium brasilianum TaxID=104259 RepID=A0A1S9RVJ2_PENBI|nr:decapping enzyme Dcp2 [Penicillium brasilianum]
MTESKMQLEDWLDDLCVRFIINLPHEELELVERICFQVEEAQWFYEDFIRPLDPALPSLSLKAFSLRIFQHCPLMSQWSHYHHMAAFSEFLAYKTRVPVRGAILLNEEMDSVVLVKGWKKGANWSFPRGKINKGEPDLDCAIREVYEETGFDVRAANLVKDEDSVKSIEVTMREQHMRLFVFPGVPLDTHFEPRTRKEISKIEWYKLSELPTLKKNKQHDEGMAVANANKFYMVAPFLHPLKKWIAQQKRLVVKGQTGLKPSLQADGYASVDENGNRPDFVSYGGGVSDLPEVDTVVSAPDASSHIKQLLKIGGGASEPVQAQASSAAQTPAVDQVKSNALLELLRAGPQRTISQVQKETVASQPSVPSGVPASTEQSHLAPNFFPGFPRQPQNIAPSNFMQQTTVQHLPGQQLGTSQGPMHAFQHQQFPISGHSELSGTPAMPQFPQMPQQSYQGLQPQSPPSIIAPPRNVVAPFQRTGDPQFSQPTQPSQVSGAIIPPASKLPPPTLTSHSLALLGFFKDGGKTPKTPHAATASISSPVTLPVPGPGPGQQRKTSLQQDSLLNLFKGPRGSPVSQPAELLGQPVRVAPPAEKQILQRPPSQVGPNQQRGAAGSNPHISMAHPSATVPGPSDMPQFEQSPKLVAKRTANAANRRSNSHRREQPQVQPLSSPITILPRPQGAKRDASTSGPHVPTVQAPPQPQIPQPAAPEPVKPFQPQILRRSEKAGSEDMFTGTSKPDTADRKPSPLGLQTNPEDRAPQANFDRRPSQTHAQKEALLSLFGKPQVSSSLTSAVQLDSLAVSQQPPNVPGLVSPLSSLQFASSGESGSHHGTPSDGEHVPSSIDRVSSPSNKAFLLSYLQGVAKGGN